MNKEDEYVSAVLTEYTANPNIKVQLIEHGYYATVTKRLLHSSMGYVCPEPDTCDICNYKPTPLTRKQKRRIKINLVRYKIGSKFLAIANKLGAYNESDCC
jgi:hypothetical protein